MTTELMTLPEFKFETFAPAVIEFNYRALSDALDIQLEKYSNVKVTAESLAADKKLAQELGAQAKAISRARIDRKKELTEPVAIFEGQMKELEGKIATVQNAINEQVRVFEQEKITEIYKAVNAEFASQVSKAGLRVDFTNFLDEVEGLVKLTAITATGALTAKTKAAILAEVNERLNTQNMVDLRLAKLEAECYRLGLAAPLNQAHVNHILLLDEATYHTELEKIVAAEVQREHQAVAAHKARIEAEAKAKAEAEANAQAQAQIAAERAAMEVQLAKEPQHQLVDVNQEPAPATQEAATSTSGKTVVTCTFELDVPAHAPSAAIEAKFRKMLEAAGFKTLANIHIQRPQNEEAE